MRDIARLAGVSAATVSLVLQGKGNLKEETRDVVNRVILETGYKRKSVSETVVHGKHFVLMVDDITNPYFHELFKGLDARLEQSGNFISVMSSHDSVDHQSRLLKELWQSDIGGVALVPATGTKREDLLEFENRRRPLIMAVRRIAKSTFDYVGANPLVGMQIAADHLISLGHKKIGLIGGFVQNHAYSERYAGFAASLMSHGLVLQPKWVANGGSTREFGQAAAKKLLSQADAPGALIAYNDLVAFGAMDAIRALGMQPGRDIAVIGYDDISEAALQPVPLTSVSTPAKKLGGIIGQAITAGTRHGSSGSPLDITYPPKLVIRSSCGQGLQKPAKTSDKNVDI